MLRYRFLLGTLFIAALVMLCWLDQVIYPGAFLLPLALMLGSMGVVELLEIFNKRGRMPLPWVLFSGVFICILLAGLPILWPKLVLTTPPGQLGWLTIGLIAGLLLAFWGEVTRYDGKWHTTLNLGLEVFSILYVGGTLGLIVQLRLLNDDPFSNNASSGMLALVSLIAVVKMSDTGQYAAGRLFGRHKLAPLVSPGKTWEGAVGGMVFAIAAAWIVFGWASHYITGASGDFASFFTDYSRLAAHYSLCSSFMRCRNLR